MDCSQNPWSQARNVNQGESESQTDSSVKINALKSFTVGNWDQFDDIWGGEDDFNIPTEEIHHSPSSSEAPYLAVHIVESSEDRDDWEQLEHLGSDPKSYQPDSLAPQLDVTSLSSSDSDSDSTQSESGSESGNETESSDSFSSILQEHEILRAQRYLALRALYPERRNKLEPRRKETVFRPTPLSIRKPEQAEGEKHCPNCDNTVYRMVSDLCLLCVMDSTRVTMKEIESAQDCYHDGYIKQVRRISDRKCAIEDERPEDFNEDAEYQGLMKEYLVRRDKAMERTANTNHRVAELEAQIKQYDAWMEADLAKLRQSKKKPETSAFL